VTDTTRGTLFAIAAYGIWGVTFGCIWTALVIFSAVGLYHERLLSRAYGRGTT